MNNAKRSAVVEEEIVQARPSARELTLFLEGELETRALRGLGEQLARLMLRGVRHVVMDMSDVSHLDYRGLKPLMERAQQLRAAGGVLKLTGLSPYLATILRFADAHSVIECYREPSSVREAFQGRSRLAH